MNSSTASMSGRASFGVLIYRAWSDIVAGLKMWELWSTLGWHDIRQRYRRSLIGPFWLTLSMGVMVLGLAYLYGGLFGQKTENYLPYVATGMIVFNLIASFANDGAMVFTSSSSRILQLKAPLSVYIFQMLWRNMIIFAHNITIYIILLLFVKIEIGWVILSAILGLFLLVFNGLWIAIIAGTLSARFRDIPPIITSVLQVAFFLTPIFWVPSSLPDRSAFVNYNPLYYLIEVVRMPLLGKAAPWSVWLFVLALSSVGAFAAMLFFARFRARLPYWV